jgi:hypothetical protein
MATSRFFNQKPYREHLTRSGASAEIRDLRNDVDVAFHQIEDEIDNVLGLTGPAHASIRQLIHLANGGPMEGFTSGAYLEYLPGGDPFPTSATWWDSPTKTKKIVEQVVTYNPNKTVATETWRCFDTDGVTVLATLVDTISYSGVFESSRVRTIS